MSSAQFNTKLYQRRASSKGKASSRPEINVNIGEIDIEADIRDNTFANIHDNELNVDLTNNGIIGNISNNNVIIKDNDISVDDFLRQHKTGGNCGCCNPKEKCTWVPKYEVRKEKVILPVEKLKEYTVIRTDYKDECYEVDVPVTVMKKEKRWRKVPIKVPEKHCKKVTVLEPFFKKVVECKWVKECQTVCPEPQPPCPEPQPPCSEPQSSCRRQSSNKDGDNNWSNWGW